MKKVSFQIMIKTAGKRLLCGILATGMIFAQLNTVSAAEASSAGDSTTVTATPTPDPHTEAYYQQPDTNSIEGWPTGPQIEATAAVVMDATTQAILYSKNADEQLYPASITKLLTGLLACENLGMKDKLVMSQAAAYGISPGDSTIYADTGEIFTVQQAIMALMLESANEMALALGEQVSGSVKKFVELMNERAEELGCTNTHFNNPNGLPDETHYTTANDMAKIARAAWNNTRFRKFFTRLSFEIPPTNVFEETRYLLNHHKMMEGQTYAYDGVVGGKTGYTTAAGNTLVTYYRKGGLTLIVVVMGGVSGAYADTAALLDYASANFEHLNLEVEEEPLAQTLLPSEQYLQKDSGNLSAFTYSRDVYVTVPKGTEASDLTKEQSLTSNAAGPLLLTSSYYYNGQFVGSGTQYEQNILSDLLIAP